MVVVWTWSENVLDVCLPNSQVGGMGCPSGAGRGWRPDPNRRHSQGSQWLGPGKGHGKGSGKSDAKGRGNGDGQRRRARTTPKETDWGLPLGPTFMTDAPSALRCLYVRVIAICLFLSVALHIDLRLCRSWFSREFSRCRQRTWALSGGSRGRRNMRSLKFFCHGERRGRRG